MHSILLFALTLPLVEVPSVETRRPEPVVLELWPDGVPGAPEIIPKEVWTGGEGDAHVANVYHPGWIRFIKKGSQMYGRSGKLTENRTSTGMGDDASASFLLAWMRTS